MTPLGVTPLGVTPLGVTPLGVTQVGAVPTGERARAAPPFGACRPSMKLAAGIRLAIAGAVAACFLGPAPAAFAQEKFPSRTVRIITPFGPGSVTDVVARILAEQLRVVLNQNVIVDNRPGALGIPAIEEMARARPDGHTLMIGNMSTNTLTPLLYRKKFSIDYHKDVVAVARLAITPTFFVVTRKDFPVEDYAQFVAYAKQHPDKVRYASTGIGHAVHYYMEYLSAHAGLKMIHIPIKQGSPGIARDLINGDVQTSFLNSSTATPLIKAGYINPIAVMGAARLPDYPDIPTTPELGIPDLGTPLWATLFAPAGTPAPVLAALHAAAGQALATPTMQDLLRKQTIQPAPTASLAETQAWMDGEFAAWRRIIGEVKLDLAD